jgi:hypothetical protein
MRTVPVSAVLVAVLLVGCVRTAGPAPAGDGQASAATGEQLTRERTGEGTAAASIDAAVPLQLVLRERRTVPLNVSSIAVASGPDERPRETVVALVRSFYKGTVLQVRGGQVGERGASLECYELQAVERDQLYHWALWSDVPLGQFRLLVGGAAGGCLAWVRGYNVVFADVSSPRDTCVAFNECLRGPDAAGTVVVPAGQLVDHSKLLGTNALYAEIEVQSITKDDAGHWVVKLCGPKSKEVYTLVYDGKQWRRE